MKVLLGFDHGAGLSIYKNMCSLDFSRLSVLQMGQECSCFAVSDGQKQRHCMLWKGKFIMNIRKTFTTEIWAVVQLIVRVALELLLFP